MIDHLVGKPSPGWKRTQVFLVIFFWLWQIYRGHRDAPRFFYLRPFNRFLKTRFTPWQIIVSVLTALYAVRNFDKILGLEAPEPLARLYSSSYYRVTWINTGLDAGFATAMSIRPKFFRDICSVVFAAYYILYPSEADEKLRRFRAVPTVQMLRATWHKATNPYIKFVTHFRLPRLGVRRTILLPRPHTSEYKRPIKAFLYYMGTDEELATTTDLILDFPGGGFVAMTPEHHEERLRIWAKMTDRPVLAIDYGKAPEYPYPWAIDEAFDTYRVLVESVGTLIGMSGRKLNIIMSGDSAGAALAVNVVIKVLEHNKLTQSDKPLITLPHPLALLLNYAALDFNFTSWMTKDNLKVLRSEQSSGNLPGLKELVAQKDHLKHVSPLSMVGDRRPTTRKRKPLRRQTSWKDTIKHVTYTSGGEETVHRSTPSVASRTRQSTPSDVQSIKHTPRPWSDVHVEEGILADSESSESEEDYESFAEEDRPISARVRYVYPQSVPNPVKIPWSPSSLKAQQAELSKAVKDADSKANGFLTKDGSDPIGTRLTMTSRTGFFQDRIISPSMMRAMAILYIGPYHNPDFTSDYYLSPILTPSELLAQFPPILLQCGEKDPFVDDTVIFCGRVRQAKRARKMELDLMLSGKSARFGEALRMSAVEAGETKKMKELKLERDKLASETEEDWVQMVLFSDWSHGYLQMPTLMSEAGAVIEELADWLNQTFASLTPNDEPRRSDDSNGTSHRVAPQTRDIASETETDDAGITFVTKNDATRRGSSSSRAAMKEFRRQQKRSKSSSPQKYQSCGSDATLLGSPVSDPTTAATTCEGATKTDSPDTVHTLNGPSLAVRGDLLGPLELEIDQAIHSGRKESRSGTVTPSGRNSSVPRTTGHKISEAELMRRRRLLDSPLLSEISGGK